MKLRNLTLASLAALMLASCGPKDGEQQKTDVVREEKVRTTVISKTEISRDIEFTTILEGFESMSISPSINGTIEHIYVEVGDRVKKGQLLVRMDQNQLNTTKLQYANLKVEMERVAALRKDGAISEQIYDQTKLSIDQTKQNLVFIEENTFVRAKMAGVIASKDYEDGELYSGQPILVLTQISLLKASINIPERFFPDVKRGLKVNLVSEIYADKVFPASIDIIYPTIDPNTHTFQVRLKIPNYKGLLRPGMYAKTTLDMGKVEAIVVPYQAVLKLTGSNKRYVYLNENGFAKRIFVELGQRFDDRIEVISDQLVVGTELVTTGQAKLIDGSKLDVIK